MSKGPRKVPAAVKEIFGNYKRNCYRGNKYWGLSIEEVETLIVKSCHYCGARQSNSMRGFRYTGIDRKDNRRGYLKENVVPCCKRCNSIKGEHLSYKEMLLVGKILRRRVRG